MTCLKNESHLFLIDLKVSQYLSQTWSVFETQLALTPARSLLLSTLQKSNYLVFTRKHQILRYSHLNHQSLTRVNS